MEIKSVSIPSFEQQMAGETPSAVKRILLGPQIREKELRAFDTDEVRASINTSHSVDGLHLQRRGRLLPLQVQTRYG